MMIFALPIFLVTTSLAQPPANEGRAPSSCEELVVPPHARRLIGRLEAAGLREGRAGIIARDLIERTEASERSEFGIRTEPYLIEMRVKRSPHLLEVSLGRLLRLPTLPDLEAEPVASNLRNPLLEVWAGLAAGIEEILRRHPTIYLVRVEGRAIYNTKLRRILGQRLGFQAEHVVDYRPALFVWRRPTAGSTFRHRTEFAWRSVSETLRQL